jgi:hypothetical protein
LLDVPGSELHFWSKKVEVPSLEVEVSGSEVGISSSEVEVPTSEVGVSGSEVEIPSKKVEVPSSEGERWGLEGDRSLVWRLSQEERLFLRMNNVKLLWRRQIK